MPDIVDLLQATARSGTSTPDLNGLEARAHQLRSRQRLLQAAALAVVVLAVPVVLSLPDRNEALEQMPATQPTTSSTVAATPRPSPASGGVTTPVGPAARPQTSRPQVAAGAPASAPRRTSATSGPSEPTRPSPTAAGGAASSCHVSTAMLLPDQSDSCQFTATQPGGWKLVRDSGAGVIQPDDAVVEVRRNGVTIRHTTGDSLNADTACADDVIRVGDLVTVTVHQTSRGYQRFDLGAGSGYGC